MTVAFAKDRHPPVLRKLSAVANTCCHLTVIQNKVKDPRAKRVRSRGRSASPGDSPKAMPVVLSNGTLPSLLTCSSFAYRLAQRPSASPE